MEALRTETPSALNDPRAWHQNLRPWFDVAEYQRRIDDRVGVNKDRKSIIRLVWGQDVMQRVYGEETPRYWTRRVKQPSGKPLYWRVPRWMLERRHEPEQYATAWEKTRWSMTDPVTGEPVDKGPAPPDYYTFAYLIAEHEAINPNDGWAACCTRAFYTDRSRCWGRYREPSDNDLDLISQAVRVMEQDRFYNPYRPVSVQELIECELTANMQTERAAELAQSYENQMAEDFRRLHGWRAFNTDPGAEHFYDLGANNTKTTPSGLIIPEI